MIEFEY